MGWGNESAKLAEIKRHRKVESDLRAELRDARAETERLREYGEQKRGGQVGYFAAAMALEAERDGLRAKLAAAERGLEMTDAELDGTRRRADRAERQLAAVRKLHKPYPFYAECEHDLEELETCGWWEADNGVFVCGPVTRQTCDSCHDDEGEPADWPCLTAAALSSEGGESNG